MSGRDRREKICPDCQATEANMDHRITSLHQGETDDDYYAVVTWHTEDCPTYTVERILSEEGVRRAKEQSEWGRREFPGAHERVKAAAADVDAGTAGPFVSALLDLVNAQGEDLGRIVLPERWVEILNKHFPPPSDESTA